MDELKNLWFNIWSTIRKPNNLWFKVYLIVIVIIIGGINIIDSLLKMHFPTFPFLLKGDDFTLNLFSFYFTIFVTLLISVNSVFSKNENHGQNILAVFIGLLVVINVLVVYVTGLNIFFACICYFISIFLWILSVSNEKAFSISDNKISKVVEGREGIKRAYNKDSDWLK